ncbi:hypothetical protein AB0I69_42755 [Streptomyces sp. NPDC050508]|uniref:hypothetical protein n=1 Tax=Streptomyces sp. NPDC050508 TaxID=3155405 RepID=UPI00343B97B9
MSVLPPSVLPLVPSTFATGDRVSHRACTLERLASGRWTCVKCGPSLGATDASVRELFVNPEFLEAQGGVPLFSPANVPDDAPLPGRPVADGESPYEAGRPYLFCSTGVEKPVSLQGVPAAEPGLWGPAQFAFTAKSVPACSDVFETSMTETGTVYLRVPGVTLAYVPADLPTEPEMVALLSYSVLLHAFAPLTVIDLS